MHEHRWDMAAARRYDAWFQTPTGSFALKQEIRLLEHMTAAWPRRGQRLLEIGCGTGIFLEVLHHAGFDVAGIDAAPAMLEAARERLGARAELQVGDAGHLPYDDNEFDFCVLFTVLEFCPDPGLVLREAARVARKAVLVGCLNRCSLFGLAMRLAPGRGALSRARWFTPWGMRRLVRDNLGRPPTRTGSVLPGPMWTWREDSLWRLFNEAVFSLPVGAFLSFGASLSGRPVMTPLPAFKAGTCPG